MINKFKTVLGILLFAFLYTISAQAQKPKLPSGFEIKLDEPEAISYFDGNKRIDQTTGFPIAIYNATTAVQGTNSEEMARNYLADNKTLFGLSNYDLANNLSLHAVDTRPAGTTVRFRQLHKGLPVNKSEITLTINSRQEVCFVMNSFSYGVDLGSVEPSLSAVDARQIAADYLAITGKIIEESNDLKVLHYQNDSKLIYRIVIASEEPLGEWEAFIDALSGEIIKLDDIGCYYKDHHEAISPGLPIHFSFFMINGGGNVFDPDPLSSANADYNDPGFPDNSDNNSPELEAELASKVLLDITFDGTNYSLVGPYAEIQDFESPNNGLFEQTTSVWDNNRQDNAFEAVNTYYHVDASMRYINETLDLDIMPTDYTTGVRFDPHGLNGADNSHYLGGSQRISFGEGGVDDAEDSDVIHHELGHGLHDWVTNGGLSQVNGLSEGSGDYWAASYNRSLGLWDPADATYNWVFIWDGHNPFWNGRVVNYAATYPGGLVGQIHTDGQIWSTCMMKVWDKIGQENSDKAFWSGLGLTNGSSNQNDAANAVFQAAINMGYSTANLTLMHDELTSCGYTLPDVPLPVELTSFTAEKKGNIVDLVWKTASEINNDYYTIERSVDGKHFDELGKQNALDGNAAISQQYAFTDRLPAKGVNYYRLKQTDLDGSFSYSEIVNVRFDALPEVKIYPNPVDSYLFVENNISDQIIKVSVTDAAGIMHNIGNIDFADRIQINVEHLPNGVYILEVQTANEVMVKQFYKK